MERRGSLLGPILLIGAGVLFLLNNLGFVDWDIWRSLLSLWPILLIAIGLDVLIGRRSVLGSLFVTVMVVALLMGGVWMLSSQRIESGDLVRYDISQPLQGAERADIVISVSAGDLILGPLPEGNQLVGGEIKLRASQDLEEMYQVSGGLARYDVRSTGVTTNLSTDWLDAGGELWRLDLNRDVPTDLRVSTGVGEAELDLERLSLTALALNVGVGDATVVLPRRGQLRANIGGGVGGITLRVPRGMAARIVVDGGLGSVSADADFQQRGDVYISDGYEDAIDRIDINVDRGLGSIRIESTSGQ